MYPHRKKVFPKLDEIVVLSQKDKALIVSIGIDEDKIRIISPYYHKFNTVKINSPRRPMVVFLGYMKRIENIEAVEWFAKNVMPLIPDIKFHVIGGDVPEALRKNSSERMHFTGFLPIPEIEREYETALCSVVPLIRGAGVKIKVIEAMSSGLPVLTNSVGIEGIPAQNENQYFHCEAPEDYASVIQRLLSDDCLRKNIGENARAFVEKEFCYEKHGYLCVENFEQNT